MGKSGEKACYKKCVGTASAGAAVGYPDRTLRVDPFRGRKVKRYESEASFGRPLREGCAYNDTFRPLLMYMNCFSSWWS